MIEIEFTEEELMLRSKSNGNLSLYIENEQFGSFDENKSQTRAKILDAILEPEDYDILFDTMCDNELAEFAEKLNQELIKRNYEQQKED